MAKKLADSRGRLRKMMMSCVLGFAEDRGRTVWLVVFALYLIRGGR